MWENKNISVKTSYTVVISDQGYADSLDYFRSNITA